jgi:hypothetical protein
VSSESPARVAFCGRAYRTAPRSSFGSSKPMGKRNALSWSFPCARATRVAAESAAALPPGSSQPHLRRYRRRSPAARGWDRPGRGNLAPCRRRGARAFPANAGRTTGRAAGRLGCCPARRRSPLPDRGRSRPAHPSAIPPRRPHAHRQHDQGLRGGRCAEAR